MGNTAIKYILKWSNEIDDIFLDDFLNVENAVFGGFSKQIFEQKIINNIYGLSLLTIAYLGEEPIGADAMIRNDFRGQICFETIDTCVLEKCRGMGVFSTITKKEVEEIMGVYPEAYIYGFPNANSFPGYVKMKWFVQHQLYPSFFISPFLYNRDNPEFIDFEYGEWLSRSSQKFYSFKCGRKYYLIKQGKRCFQMIGRIEPAAALLFERKSCPGLIKYFIKRHSLLDNNKYQGSIITYGKPQFDIPYWKHDAFLG